MISLKITSLCTSCVPSPRDAPHVSKGNLWIGCSRMTEAAPNMSAAHVVTSLAIITLVSGNLDLLYERLGDKERRKMIRDIRQQTQNLNRFVSEVLTLCTDCGPLPMVGQ